MSNVTSPNLMIKMRMRREYESLCKQYETFPYPVLPNHAIKYICTAFKVRGIISTRRNDATVDIMSLNDGNEILRQMNNLEYDYEFITDTLLQIDLNGGSFLDIYFPKPLTD